MLCIREDLVLRYDTKRQVLPKEESFNTFLDTHLDPAPEWNHRFPTYR